MILVKLLVVLVQESCMRQYCTSSLLIGSLDLATTQGFGPQFVRADSMRGTADDVNVLHGIAALVSCLSLEAGRLYNVS